MPLVDYAELAKRLRAKCEHVWHEAACGTNVNPLSAHDPCLKCEAADAIEALTSPPDEAQVVSDGELLEMAEAYIAKRGFEPRPSSSGTTANDLVALLFAKGESRLAFTAGFEAALNAAYRFRVKNEAKA